MADGHPSAVTNFRNKICQQPTWWFYSDIWKIGA